MPSFPIAPKRPYLITQHGETRVDDYFWLRNRQDPEVMKYLTAQMDYLEEVMGRVKPFQESLFLEMKARIQETDSTVPEKRGRYWYYARTEAGKQYPIFCRRKDSMDHPEEEVLLDQNILAEGQIFCSVSGLAVSPDGNKLAYSVDYEGAEVYTAYIKDLVNGSHYPESIPNIFGSVYFHTGLEWANDSETVFYVTQDEAKRPHKLYRHKIGGDVAQDVLIFHEEDEHFNLYVYKSRDDKFIFTGHHSTLTTEMRYLSADQPVGELTVIARREHGVEYFAAHHDGTFFIATNENARNFKLMKASIPHLGKDAWQQVIPHRMDVMIEGLDTFENHLVLYERRAGLKQIRVSLADGVSNLRYVQFPDPAYYFELENNSNFSTNVLRFKYSSLITPHTVVDYHMDTGVWDVKKVDAIHGFDKNDYVIERIFATAPDGTRVPVSVAYRKSLKLDGNNPALLHGYGAYGANLDAEFIAHRLSLLDRGFVVAVAHIRGGSDLGREWYEDGKVLKKKNSFTDFIACAEHLIQKGYTSKDRLAIYGVSAGGLLVTASTVMRPDLFKAVIAKVPFVDVINSISDPTIPLTTLEYDEWGNPVEFKEHYEYMKSYSPYDNLQAAAYPNILLTGGLNDPRVPYWEPAKFAAKLRELKTDDNLLLLKTNFHAGHAGSSGRYDFLREVAFEYTFLIDRLLGDGHS
ncbi:MAG TPA: S9 family peptidase [Anaerolineales bacterium]|nr:S9 family peptidase [Anaerolineales bacterium]